MPIYEYRCPTCRHEFEELVRAADADRQKCPKCGAKAGRQLSVFSSAAAAPSPSPAPGPACGSCGMNGGSCPYQ